MKNGNWIPISKGFLKALPHDREYTELEAAYSLQLDFDHKNKVTITGYCNLWRWSKGKVYRFLDRMNIKILYPESTSKKRNQSGYVTICEQNLYHLKGIDKNHQKDLKNGLIIDHKPDLKRTNGGLIRLIDNSDLQKETDLKRTKNGLKTDLKQVTTIEPKPLILKPKQKESNKEKHLEFVFLTKDEYEKLEKKLGANFDDMIERLNNYIGSSGKKYKSHYHTILNWSKKEERSDTNNDAKYNFK